MKNEKIPGGTLSSGELHYRQSLALSSVSEGLYGGIPPEMGGSTSSSASSQCPTATSFMFASGSKLGFPLMPNPAPDVDLAPPIETPAPARLSVEFTQPPPEQDLQPKRKKYAKEAWPGKKPAPSLLI